MLFLLHLKHSLELKHGGTEFALQALHAAGLPGERVGVGRGR